MDIKLKDFEGPLDLLLHLVSKYQVDIYDVPIVEVIEQYLAYINTLTAMRLEVAGEYMVMASQLMLIKSRKLLPIIVESEVDEDDPEMDLLNQIEEYRKYKRLSQELAEQHAQRAMYFSKPKQEIIVENATLVNDKTVMDLFLAFSKIMSQKQEELKANHTVIEQDDFKIEDKMIFIEDQLKTKSEISLDNLFRDCKSINEVITLFLATLELIKIQTIIVNQDQQFGEIRLRKEIA
ncbi:hypothetical protein HMPREF9318_01175 [Streptococcus urinalis FB127-CNA-2]|uniref:Segregation and condensation protein A n=1 Tax=Streptococcus urinalis 2285-97 TaxID=764291 RepID=G5KI49_9STRE|nr:segregation/condensation protein A [Streptococcus urinalis]EHJ57769.1 ScpA/B protein [Streptococcus urinalis 2285-97]EKS20537.1 hypothetical protein HMPREF9318_01175 [Streptococcus urinalis FB127-CNA-2]VEF31230.1 segregation and condensation protein A [Streptococcus urinalis]